MSDWKCRTDEDSVVIGPLVSPENFSVGLQIKYFSTHSWFPALSPVIIEKGAHDPQCWVTTTCHLLRPVVVFLTLWLSGDAFCLNLKLDWWLRSVKMYSCFEMFLKWLKEQSAERAVTFILKSETYVSFCFTASTSPRLFNLPAHLYTHARTHTDTASPFCTTLHWPQTEIKMLMIYIMGSLCLSSPAEWWLGTMWLCDQIRFPQQE